MHVLVDAHYKGRAKLPKRAVDEFFDSVKKPKAACYLGCIYYGIHNKASDGMVVQELVDEGYDVLRRWAEPPCDHDLENAGTIAGILIHLNDMHDGRQMKEQQITDWFIIALNNNYASFEELLAKNT